MLNAMPIINYQSMRWMSHVKGPQLCSVLCLTATCNATRCRDTYLPRYALALILYVSAQPLLVWICAPHRLPPAMLRLCLVQLRKWAHKLAVREDSPQRQHLSPHTCPSCKIYAVFATRSRYGVAHHVLG